MKQLFSKRIIRILCISYSILILFFVGLFGLFIQESAIASTNKGIAEITIPELPKEYHTSLITTRTTLPYYLPVEYKKYVTDLCDYYEIPIDIFCRMISEESKWKINAVHSTYDDKGNFLFYDGMGLGQLNQRMLEVEFNWRFNDGQPIDPFDPYQNLLMSIKVLHWAYDCAGTWSGALIIYNCGYGKWSNNRIPASTFTYFNDILYNIDMELY